MLCILTYVVINMKFMLVHVKVVDLLSKVLYDTLGITLNLNMHTVTTYCVPNENLMRIMY